MAVHQHICRGKPKTLTRQSSKSHCCSQGEGGAGKDGGVERFPVRSTAAFACLQLEFVVKFVVVIAVSGVESQESGGGDVTATRPTQRAAAASFLRPFHIFAHRREGDVI